MFLFVFCFFFLKNNSGPLIDQSNYTALFDNPKKVFPFFISLPKNEPITST